MNDPTYLVHPPTTPHQRQPPTTTNTTAHINSNNNISSKEAAPFVGSNSGGVGGDQDGWSAQEIQATAKVSAAGLESVLRSAVSEPTTSSKETITTTTTTVAEGGRDEDADVRVESPQIVRSASLRNHVPQPVSQQVPVATPVVVHAKKVEDPPKSQPQLATPQSQQKQKQQAQTTITTTPGGGYEYSPPRQHIFYSHTRHSHTQHHHHHRLHHHHAQHHQHSSSTGSTGSSEKQKKNRRFSYSKVGVAPSPTPPPPQQQQDAKASGPTEEGGLNRRVGAVDNNGSLGLLVDPTPKCCKVRAHLPQLTVTTSPVPAPSRTFASMPSTASPETASGGGASLSPASAAPAGSMKDGSDVLTVDSSVSSSASVSSGSSMTSVSPSSVTEHSHSRLHQSEKDSTESEGKLIGSDSRRGEKEEGRRALTVDGVDAASLAPQTQQPSSSPISSEQYLAHATTTEYQQQQQKQQQKDQVIQDQQHALELYHQVLPPTSTDHIHLQPYQEEQDLYLRPRVCKMVMKHPSVKLDWKVPEPIKAGGEVVRGVLIITAKELLESEVKAAVKSKSGSGGGGKKKKMKQDRAVWVEHIEIDLTGLEEVTTGAGLLSRTRTDRHCFLHKTQVLPIEELKCILDTSSPSSSSSSSSSSTSSTSHTATLSSQSGTTSAYGHIPSRSSSLMHSASSLAETDLAQPGKLPPGTQQGISFQMRIPERVGGTYRNAHASISYQLTANVHIRRGKEMFVLQHPLPLSLFELVQIRAATKITSPHDLNPSTSINNKAMTTTTASSSSSFISATSSVSSEATAGGVKRQAGVRFVIPKANSVLGTAAVKPYSLWGLGPATSSSSSSSHYGHGHNGHHDRRQSSHQRRGSLGAPPPSAAAPSTGGSTSLSAHQAGVGSGMTRSYSDIGALSSHSKDGSASSASATGSLSGNASVSVKKARFDPDEMLSAEDQYRSRQLKQQQQQQQQQQQYQQELDLQQQGSTGGSRQKLGSRKDSTDGLDEAGFGAHIDKSVAAAGENVTMDMFVVKSDVMKVVDIKVSLVETIQIFSLLDHDSACAVVSPIAGRAHVFDNNNHQHSGPVTEAGAGTGSKRRLVETHMVKIAKAYVPAQAEESHANDNHLKGYYEDYEDARTTKSLSMYKLGMRIPETALTIQDRDLLKVDYMFVIKFFFKGRMGAFLELPIEIVSQYNHNRISTISGAISCVSNSVQIALPPVPILVKRHDSTTSSSTSAAKVVEVKEVEAAKEDVKGEAIAASATYSLENERRGQRRDEEERVEGVKESQSAEEIQASPISRKDAKDVTPTEFDPRSMPTSVNLKSISQNTDPSSEGISSSIEKSSTSSEEQVDRTSQLQDPPSKNNSTAFTSDVAETQKSEEEGILASSQLSKAEFAVCGNRQVGLAVARYNQMLSTGTTNSATTAAATGSGKDLKRTTSKPMSAVGAEGVPKIVIESVHTRSGSSGPASSSSISTSSSSSTTTTTTTTTTVISPALPILFDLTSAALPTPAASAVSPPTPAPLVIPQSTGGSSGPSPMLVTPGVRSSSMGAGTTATSFPVADSIAHSNSFPRSAKDTELQLPKLLPLRQGTNTSVYTSSSREDDHHHHHHHPEADGSKSTTGGLVAKIAKSLSSPLLRTRPGTAGSNISPNGSQSTLLIPILSPQHQQSSAFTLAATTLSALTLLSAVGQAAVSSEGKKAPQPAPRPLKSCIKKRSSVRPPGLNTGNLTVSGGGGQHPRSAAPSQGQGQGHPYSATGTNTNRKRVTFAKGLTPVPSPTGSQVMLAESIVLEPFKHKSQHQYLNNTTTGSYSASSSSNSASLSLSSATGAATVNGLNPAHGLSTSVRTNPGIAAAAAPITATPRPNVPTPHYPHHQHPHQHQVPSAMTTITAPTMAQASAGPTKSPNSAGPRTRMHHPFDRHPSRLSPLGKKHLDFQVQIQELKSSSLHDRAAASKDLSSKSVTDHGDEDDEEEVEDDEEECEGEEEEEFEEEEDEDEDDQESEEERIERRKQARIAWLAKYGDAFKQVYGAVPELPPL